MAKPTVSFTVLQSKGAELEHALTAWLMRIKAGVSYEAEGGVKQHDCDAWEVACKQGLIQVFGDQSKEVADWDAVGNAQEEDKYFKANDIYSDCEGYITKFLYYFRRRLQLIKTVAMLFPDPPPKQINVHMRDYYKTESAVHVGAINAETVNMVNNAAPMIDAMDQSLLLAQLQLLREKMAQESAKNPDVAISLGYVASAEKAVKAGEKKPALEYLKNAGTIALKFAKEITVSLVADLIKELLFPGTKGTEIKS